MKDAQVLVLGASRGCGLPGLQLAKALGVQSLVAVCSGKNTDMVKAHGTTEVVDYTQEDILTHYQV